MSTLKEKVLNKEKMVGTHININDPVISSIVSQLDFDFVWIDMEHSYLTLPNLLSHIVALKNAGKPVIVRVPQHDFTMTKKIIEMGPDGIIFPMIRSKEEADELIAYTLYPPYGNRGFGPQNAIHYGLESDKEFVKTNHQTMCRFIQVEHISLVEELEEVVKNPYIDGYIFGPNDLSGSINHLLDVFCEENLSLMRRVIDILNKNDKYIGLSTGSGDPEVIKKWSDMGIHMISAVSDFGLLARGMKQTAEILKIHKN